MRRFLTLLAPAGVLVSSMALAGHGQNFVLVEEARLPPDTGLRGTSTTDVDLVDVDGDGDLDLFKAEGTDSLEGRPNQLLINTGAGRFVDASATRLPPVDTQTDPLRRPAASRGRPCRPPGIAGSRRLPPREQPQ